VANKLFYFLVVLSENIEIQKEFSRDPEGVMARHGLTRDEMAAVLSGDDSRVRSMADVGPDFALRMHLHVYPRPPKKKQARKPRKARK